MSLEEIEKLRPHKKSRIIDLVEACGHDISGWGNYHGAPSQNPNFCYEWAYWCDEMGALLNIWWKEIKPKNNDLVVRMNLKNDIENYSRSGRGPWTGRAKRMLGIINKAATNAAPIRVILLDGKTESASPSSRPSSVTARELDYAFWRIGEPNLLLNDIELIRWSVPVFFEDQFSSFDEQAGSAGRRTVTNDLFVRDRFVREEVLARARGHCEYCGRLGFETVSGKIYLETHHVIPLSEDGLDVVENVIALCPEHHRQAHYSLRKQTLLDAFLLKIQSYR
ncbi:MULTISPECIES: HNH endonuclease signature motif containing protein [Alphaproteobacteria]|uniref:HNH endonuclease n=1 Tax=Alphaproteobacteria TaxID=28211 RepID=UPI00326391F8